MTHRGRLENEGFCPSSRKPAFESSYWTLSLKTLVQCRYHTGYFLIQILTQNQFTKPKRINL